MDCCLTRLIEGTVRKKTYRTKVRFATKIELKHSTLVRYGKRCEVRSSQILNVPYRTANPCSKLAKNLLTKIQKNCVLGPCFWTRPFLSLASKAAVLEKLVRGLEGCVLDSTSAFKPWEGCS